MNKYVKIMGVMALGLLVANCSGTNYKIKTEKSKVLNEVPKWYVNDFSKKKAKNRIPFASKHIKSKSLASRCKTSIVDSSADLSKPGWVSGSASGA